jgi:hypothetical protein
MVSDDWVASWRALGRSALAVSDHAPQYRYCTYSDSQSTVFDTITWYLPQFENGAIRLAMRGKTDRRRLREATVRVGGALGITAVLRDLGLDPDEVLTEAGIDPRLLDDPDNLITYRARGRLMTRAVVRSGRQHFGLMVGERMNLESLGLLGLLARNSTDVRSALERLVNFMHLHARGAVMGLTVDHVQAILTYDAYQPGVEATDQTGDAAVAMMLNVMRSLCGSGFRPTDAWFAHRRPADVRPFRRLFQAPL